jgi:hypothetical protein
VKLVAIFLVALLLSIPAIQAQDISTPAGTRCEWVGCGFWWLELMIDIKELRPEHVGKWVEYRGGPGKIETGKIKSWNDRVVFVVYRFTGSDENEVIRQARVCCDGNSHRIFL